MTPEQEQHLLSIKHLFNIAVDIKYRRGQREHGGDLAAMPAHQLIDCAIDEAVDQVVYLLTLREKMLKPAAFNMPRVNK